MAPYNCGHEAYRDKSTKQHSFYSCIQWGLEFRPFENRIHSKTERFKVRFSNGSVFEWTIRKPNIQNGRFSLGRFIYSKKKLFFYKIT